MEITDNVPHFKSETKINIHVAITCEVNKGIWGAVLKMLPQTKNRSSEKVVKLHLNKEENKFYPMAISF
jgi:hypothetical protein